MRVLVCLALAALWLRAPPARAGDVELLLARKTPGNASMAEIVATRGAELPRARLSVGAERGGVVPITASEQPIDVAGFTPARPGAPGTRRILRNGSGSIGSGAGSRVMLLEAELVLPAASHEESIYDVTFTAPLPSRELSGEVQVLVEIAPRNASADPELREAQTFRATISGWLQEAR
jgi:hypothetical protein